MMMAPIAISELCLAVGLIFGVLGGYVIGWNRGCSFMEKRWDQARKVRP